MLFVLAIAALVMGKAEALYFAAPCLLVMALWGSGTNPLGGYGLWLLAGLGVFVLSVVYFWRKKEMSVGRFLISGPFIVSYCFGLVFLLNGLLDNGA